MDTRLKISEMLHEICDHVYFQPAESVKLVYPCIVYKMSRVEINHANNGPYKHQEVFQITAIDRNPDSEIPKKIAFLPKVGWNTQFVKDNLYHTVFTLYY